MSGMVRMLAPDLNLNFTDLPKEKVEYLILHYNEILTFCYVLLHVWQII